MSSNINPPEPPYPQDAWGLLGQERFSETRRARMFSAAHARTKHIRLVVQDVHSPHNISACMRSAEAFGILHVDVVNLKEKFRGSNVSRGVERWMRVRKFRDVKSCAQDLHDQGFRIAAAIPRQDAVTVYEVPVDKPLAVVFGNEREGVDAEWQDVADIYYTIPMVGLVESFNISVSAALSLHEFTRRARIHPTVRPTYHLPQSEIDALLNEWTCRQVPTWSAELEAIRHKPSLVTPRPII